MKKINIYAINIKKVVLYTSMICTITILMCISNYYTNESIEVVSNGRLLPIYSVETSDKKVALTFDCAWGADDIPEILDILSKNDVTATFFVVGTWIDKFPDTVKSISNEGHDIGNHSNSHAHVNKLSYEANLEDMEKCNEKIRNLTDEEVTLYRGPYGEYNNVVIEAAKAKRMQVIQWDIDTLDYTGLTPDEMCGRISKKIRNGSIVLMHNDTKYTANGLQQIIDLIKEKGYEIVSVSNLIYKEDYKINTDGRQMLKNKM